MTLSKNKVYLNVPFERKDEAKAIYGCRWDQDIKSWYCMKSNQEAIEEFGNSNQQVEEEFVNTVTESPSIKTNLSNRSTKESRIQNRINYIDQYLTKLSRNQEKYKAKKDKYQVGTKHYQLFNYDFWEANHLFHWITQNKTYLIEKRMYDTDIDEIWRNMKNDNSSYSYRDFNSMRPCTLKMIQTRYEIIQFMKSQRELKRENERIDNLMV